MDQDGGVLESTLAPDERRVGPVRWAEASRTDQPRHEHRVVRCQTSPIPPFILGVNGGQIQFVHHVGYKSRQVILRQPIL